MVIIDAKDAFLMRRKSGAGSENPQSQSETGGKDRPTSLKKKPARWGMSLVEAVRLEIEGQPTPSQAREMAEAKSRQRSHRLMHLSARRREQSGGEDDDPDAA
jgi:hypothetical protein